MMQDWDEEVREDKEKRRGDRVSRWSRKVKLKISMRQLEGSDAGGADKENVAPEILSHPLLSLPALSCRLISWRVWRKWASSIVH